MLGCARDRLERWGYPWVFDAFDFHLTLGTGAGARSAAEDAAWLRWLRRVASRCALDGPQRLDRLALCSQDAPQRPFVRGIDCPLTGQSDRAHPSDTRSPTPDDDALRA